MPTDAAHAKLTAVTTTTLSLLLERQRLQSTHPTLHLAQIVANLRTLRSGIVARGDDDDVAELRAQYERLRGMLGPEEAEKAGLESIPLPERTPSPSPPSPMPDYKRSSSLEPLFEPYTDADDELSHDDILLQQRQTMNEQDAQLDHLSTSIHRQHHISLQIHDELEAQTGLLGELDTELDGTDARLGRARRQLARVARGAKENGSTVTIGLLILVLLILIVVFKT